MAPFSATEFLFDLESPVVLAKAKEHKPALAIEDEHTVLEIIVICIWDLLTPAC